VIDGGIAGVGGVLAFLPNVLILFFAIAVLEDSGYMARAAFILDRWMHKVGLHGKSFIPLIIGFGCTVPALMATRVLESRRDRLTTMLILPLMSCGARLPIYVLFTGALWSPRWQAPVMWTFYLVGALTGLLLAKLLTATVFRGQTEPFVMELPPFRAPTLRGAFLHTWQRGGAYLRRAGTIILVISIALWALSSYPKPSPERLAGLAPSAQAAVAAEASAAGQVGQWLEPATRPLGFDWQANTALIGAVAAKEVFVAQMGIVSALSVQDDRQAEPLATSIARHYTPLQAVAIMLFCLLGLPCAATFAVMRHEAGSWKWAALQWGGLTAIAYVVTLLVYQAGLLFGLGTGVG
jgi:ferrous iron transport protein B